VDCALTQAMDECWGREETCGLRKAKAFHAADLYIDVQRLRTAVEEALAVRCSCKSAEHEGRMHQNRKGPCPAGGDCCQNQRAMAANDFFNRSCNAAVQANKREVDNAQAKAAYAADGDEGAHGAEGANVAEATAQAVSKVRHASRQEERKEARKGRSEASETENLRRRQNDVQAEEGERHEGRKVAEKLQKAAEQKAEDDAKAGDASWGLFGGGWRTVAVATNDAGSRTNALAAEKESANQPTNQPTAR